MMKLGSFWKKKVYHFKQFIVGIKKKIAAETFWLFLPWAHFERENPYTLLQPAKQANMNVEATYNGLKTVQVRHELLEGRDSYLVFTFSKELLLTKIVNSQQATNTSQKTALYIKKQKLLNYQS